jgi:N-methylhydantoinase B
VTLRRITEAGNARVEVDFRGTHQQVAGNINCPISVAAAAVFYVFRCLMQAQTPACAGAFRLIRLSAPKACLVNAESPAAVAAGNVETSMRISDVVMGALAQALPERIPAASGGSMNNLALGAVACGDTQGWDYYETIGNGAGAADGVAGQSAVQTHMTNTLNTPIETMELKYPLRVTEYSIRRHSGGHGRFPGGDGIVREIEFLQVAQATVLSERRTQQPWGLYGGGPGKSGRNSHNGKTIAAKVEISLKPGDKLKIETPGGGGYAERVPAES